MSATPKEQEKPAENAQSLSEFLHDYVKNEKHDEFTIELIHFVQSKLFESKLSTEHSVFTDPIYNHQRTVLFLSVAVLDTGVMPLFNMMDEVLCFLENYKKSDEETKQIAILKENVRKMIDLISADKTPPTFTTEMATEKYLKACEDEILLNSIKYVSGGEKSEEKDSDSSYTKKLLRDASTKFVKGQLK